MALAVALERGRKRKPWERSPWDERAMAMSGISLDEIASRHRHNRNVHDSAPTAYVLLLPIVSVSNTISNGMTHDMEEHMRDADKFNEWYANRGIEQVVEKEAGFFERAVDTAYSTINGIKSLAVKAVSVVPTPARKYAVSGSLAGMLLLTACNGKGNDAPVPTPTPDAARGLFVNFPFSVASANYDGNMGLLQGSLTLKNIAPHTFTTEYRTIIMDNNGNWQRVSDWAKTPEFAFFDPNEIVNVPFSIDNAKQDTNFMVQIKYEVNGETLTFNYTRKAIEEHFGPIGFIAPTVTPVSSTPVATATPTTTPTPTLEAKLFEFVFAGSTPEQYKTFSENALEDYRKVLGVYGIDEKDARLKVIVEKTEDFSIGFYFKNKVGGNAWVGFDAFTTNRAKFRHETAHAINHTLFPTYHLWFDEGMANYSGGIKDFDINDPRVKAMVGQLNSNPNKFWESKIEDYTFEGSINTPTHLIGSVLFYMLMSNYVMTEEQNRSAIKYLADAYRSNGQEISRTDIQNAYESALGKNLSAVFDTIGMGNKILWNAIMKAKPAGIDTPDGRDYIRVKKVLSEF